MTFGAKRFGSAHIFGMLLLCGLLLLPNGSANAFVTASTKMLAPLSKNIHTLAEEEILKLARMIKGRDDVGRVKKIIGQKNLPNEALEDAFTRIAIARGSLPRQEAEAMFKNLRGVNGFSSTMSKTIGMNPGGTRGHLNELRIANAAANRGFKVEGIGLKYNDGIKKSDTDLDVLISKNGKRFPIEAKDYDDISFADLSDPMRPDMDSLVAYKNMSPSPDKTHPVFTITHRPTNPNVEAKMKKDADRRGIELIFGSPEEQLMQLETLMKII